MSEQQNTQKYINIISHPYWRNEYVLKWMKERNVYPDELKRHLNLSRPYAEEYFYRPFRRLINHTHWLQILDYFGIDEADLPYKMANPKEMEGAWIQKQLAQKGITYVELGEAIGLSRNGIQKIAYGERKGSEIAWTKICYFFQEQDEKSGKI